jgi:ATP-dependent RNA helicase DeaD
MQDGYDADALHGDLSQSQRDYVMGRFRQKNIQILVATDVAARGLDVNELTHVINFSLPDDNESYTHRSGRTGRAGNKGLSVSIIHSRETRKIKELEKSIGQKFEHKQIPTGADICEKQLFKLIDKVENVNINNEQIEKYLPDIYKKLEWLSREELIQRFVSVEFNRFLDYYKKASDINVKPSSSSSTKGELNKVNKRNRKSFESDNYEPGKGFSRFFINVGHQNGLTAPKMIGLINDNTSQRNIPIGKIDLMKRFSFFEVGKDFESLVLKSFKNSSFDGTKLTVQISKPDNSGGGRRKRK